MVPKYKIGDCDSITITYNMNFQAVWIFHNNFSH